MQQETWIQIATGPVAALALCIFAIYFVARWLATNVPKWVDRHLTQIDTMIVSHKEDRKIYADTLQEMNKGLQTLHGDIQLVKDDVREIKNQIK